MQARLGSSGLLFELLSLSSWRRAVLEVDDVLSSLLQLRRTHYSTSSLADPPKSRKTHHMLDYHPSHVYFLFSNSI